MNIKRAIYASLSLLTVTAGCVDRSTGSEMDSTGEATGSSSTGDTGSESGSESGSTGTTSMDEGDATGEVSTGVTTDATDSSFDTGPCAEDEPFSIDAQVLQAAEVDEAMASVGQTDPQSVTCEDYCLHMVLQQSSSGFWGYISVLNSCSIEFEPDYLDELAMTGTIADPSIPAATLSCEGVFTPECLGGRPPLGHRIMGHGTTGTPLARCLAAFAALEEASVRAFDELAEQLESWRAPSQLIARCRAAARDEVEHFELLSTLASQGGATPSASTYDEVSQSLFEVALHNAVEGCVGETWSAYLAHCWARQSSHPELRRVFAQIAADETRHAQLSWDLHSWFISQLSPTQAKAVNEARRAALANLPELARRQIRGLPAALGTPAVEVTAQLAEDFAGRLAA